MRNGYVLPLLMHGAWILVRAILHEITHPGKSWCC